jgi:hypothetical protein
MSHMTDELRRMGGAGSWAAEEIERLRVIEAAAERVCWFDWSGNDADAVAAIEELRRALPASGQGSDIA